MLKENDILNTSFDKYLIVEQIGVGGNGTVYKVKNEDGAIYAAKVVCKNALSKEKIKRFKNEIAFCQKHEDAHIIKVLDYGYLQTHDKEFLFYIMPFFECTLRKRMSSPLQITAAIQLFLSLCEGLKFSHSHGCIHRDIKPENILINSAKNICVIADFGIAHFMVDDKKTTVETREHSRLANFTYHAPEQSSATYQPAPTTDIYALGLILNEMITGVVPAGDNYKKIADIDEAYSFLDKIVSKTICQNPKERYQSIDEILLDYTARKQIAEKDKKIASLRTPLLQGEIHDDLTDNPPQVVDIKLENGLYITLSNAVNRKWEEIYYNDNVLGQYTTSPYCYRKFRFYDYNASYNGTIPMSEHSLKGLITEFKTAISNTNKRYSSWLVAKTQRERQDEVERRQKEIERLEKEKSINSFLKGLI